MNRRKQFMRRGAAAVEMAVVAPVLITLLLGMIEFGRAMMVVNVMTSAAREGARRVAVPNSTNTDATTAINNELSAANVPTGSATTTIKVNGSVANASTAVTGDTITVTVAIPYSAVTWLPTTLFISNSTSMTGSAVMRRE
jgi:Flp pilus assembly protein TadG